MGSLCGSSGTSTATTSQSTNPNALPQIQGVFDKVASAASTPYTPYTGELTAGNNAQQAAGTSTINNAATAGNPYFSGAGTLINNAANPLTTAQINNYLNPYTQDVVNKTQAQFNDTNAQQLNQIRGSAAQNGALGGDRATVAQTTALKNDNIAQAPVIAGLYNSGYQGALNTAYQQYQQNPLAAGSALLNTGTAATNAGIAGGTAQLGAGTQQQQTQQAADTAKYGQYQAQQGFPYQQAAFLEQYGLPSALAQGSSSNGTQTSTPAPQNMLSQGLGLGLTAASLFAKDGGRIDGYAPGGSVGYVSAPDYITAGAGYLPMGQASQNTLQSPNLSFMKPNAQSSSSSPMSNTDLKGLGTTLQNNFGSASYGGGNMFSGDEWGGDKNHPAEGLTADDYGYAKGGLVDAIHHIHRAIKGARGHYADGGSAADGFGGSLDQNPSIGERIARTVSGGRNFGERALYNATRTGLLNTNTASEDGPTYGGIGRGLRDRRNSDMLDAEMIARKVRGYDDGGTASFADRFQPAADAPLTPFSAPSDVVNPDTPFRMPDQKAVQAWRKDVDQPNPAVVADSGVPLPKEIINPDNTPSPPINPMTTAFAGDTQGPMGANGLPTVISPVGHQEEGGHGLFGLSDKTKQSLLAAGLGMMASRSPYLGTALGEGGLHGLKAYSDQSAAEQAAADKAASRAQTQQQIDMRAKELADTLEQHRRAAASAGLIPDGKGGLMVNPKYIELKKQEADINEKIPPGYRATKEGLEAIPGGPADPSTIKSAAEAKRVANAVLDDDTIHDMADQYLAGDRTVMQNLGRGAQGAENIVKLRQAIAKQARDAGVDPKGIVNAFNEQAGALAGQRAVGTRAANISLAANEANNMIPIALAASDKLPRSQFMPWNSMVQAVQKGASSPELASFVAATNSLVNSYVRAVSPSGVPTDSMRQHAYDMLNAAQGPEAYKAVIATMKLEMEAALQAPGQVKAELRKGNEPAAGTTSAPTGAKPTLQQFLDKAKVANPDKSDTELTNYYKKKYGG